MTQPSVLVIDDDAAVRNAVAEDLKREGYDLHFATDGMEGLKRVKDVDPTRPANAGDGRAGVFNSVEPKAVGPLFGDSLDRLWRCRLN